jgi:hypothetical protein
MKWKVTKKSVLWIIGAIVISILSNGIWEFLIRPVLLYFQNGLLNLITLGIQEYKDAIYQEIARGHYDRASEDLLGVVLGGIVILLGAATAFQYGFHHLQKKRREQIRSSLNAIEADKVVHEPPTIESVKADFASIEQEAQTIPRLILLQVVLVTLLARISVTLAVRIKYIGSAVAYYDQLTAIATPFLTDDKAKLTASQFAQITNGNDYERIILELRSVAEANGQRVPKFTIW